MKLLVFLLSAALALAPAGRAEAPGADKFAAGKRKTFSTQGHEEARGVNLTIAYPETWEATSSNSPNVVQVITSSRGFGTEMLILETKDLGTTPAAGEMAKYFRPEALRVLVPQGAKALALRPTTLLGRPGGILEFTSSKQIGVKMMELQTLAYVFIQGSTMVQVQFQVSASSGGGAPPVAQRMQECKPLFEQMVKTITLQPPGK
jgi:hypothetical protein